jgi:hypothetical protein
MNPFDTLLKSHYPNAQLQELKPDGSEAIYVISSDDQSFKRFIKVFDTVRDAARERYDREVGIYRSVTSDGLVGFEVLDFPSTGSNEGAVGEGGSTIRGLIFEDAGVPKSFGPSKTLSNSSGKSW